MAKSETLTMRTIDEHIKNSSFSPVYLLYGEEEYLKKQYKQKLKNALTSPDDTMNFSLYEGKGVNQKEIIDLAETLPFFSERRVILLENSELCKTSADDLSDYVKNMSEDNSTIIILVESEIDKRNKLYKAINDKGSCIEFSRQDNRVLIQWVLARLKKEKKNITQPVMELFLSRTGDDMERIDKELEKLICYTIDKDVIEFSDVNAVCAELASNKIFDMISSIANKDQKKALELYYDLLALKEPSMRILFLISRQFNILLMVKSCLNSGKSQRDIASICKIPPFAVKNHIAQANKFSLNELKAAVADGVAAEEDIKTGRMNDQLAVELLIVKYSS